MSIADLFSQSGAVTAGLGLQSLPGGSFLRAIAFEAWPGDWLSRARFENLLYGFAVVLAVVTAGLMVLELFVRRAGVKISRATTGRICLALTVAGFFSYFGFFNPNTRYVHYYHRHEFFHYYLGSKYSEELGYGRIYECAAIAEIQLGHRDEVAGQELRDLRARNLIRPIKDTYVFKDPGQCTDRFTETRWNSFKQDLKWFRGSATGNYWVNMKKDHGYNPPPVWTMTGKLITKLGPAGDTMFKWLSSIDIFLHIGVLALFRWAFGWRVAAIASVFWGCNTAANFYWTGGAFLRQDWGFLFIASLCLAKKKKFGLSGAAFVWAGMLRIFPLAAGFGWGVMIALHWLKHRRLHADHRRFIAGACIALGVLGTSSVMVTGVEAYKEFASHISLHKNTPLTNHMGLETTLVHNWDGRMRFTRDDSMDDSFEGWKAGRTARKAAATPVFIAVWLILAGWITWAVHRSKHFWIGLPLSVPLVMCLTNLTCYYYVLFLSFATLARLRPAIGTALVLTAGASQILLKHFYWIDDRYNALSYLFLTMALCTLYGMSRVPTRVNIQHLLSSLGFNRSLKPAAKKKTADGV